MLFERQQVLQIQYSSERFGSTASAFLRDRLHQFEQPCACAWNGEDEANSTISLQEFRSIGYVK